MVAVLAAGVVSWWLLALPVTGLVLMIVFPRGAAMIGVSELVAVGIGMFVGAVPTAVIGLGLVGRASSRVRDQEAAASV